MRVWNFVFGLRELIAKKNRNFLASEAKGRSGYEAEIRTTLH